eukprot:CAMPEP_0168756328 /NCGR_PEP_ID=MMETSP0724-20121128/20553_1 /TAXON_ID=265536 /ORGANISM="Amphiprora sp., Strain CCMP467" /LENGTH=36 /DNA_ID= /DNA_START= /DNA_END= /DNA_ORIENTATION=
MDPMYRLEKVVLDRLTNAISAYDNSDIPDEIDIDAL